MDVLSVCSDILDSFCHPLSHEIIKNSVLETVSGHPYERAFIEDYVKRNIKDLFTLQQIN